MSIYQLSYKNLRRNWWRNTSTVLRIGFGVMVLLILISSGVGFNTVLGQNEGGSGNISAQKTNNIGINNIITSLGEYVNSVLGTELSNTQLVIGVRKILRSIISIIDVLASLIFLVGILGINYAMDLNLRERGREIGLLKSLGFTELQIILAFMLEAGLLGFIGAIFGTVLVLSGIFVLSGIIKIQLFSIVMPVWLPFGAILLTVFLSAFLPLFSIWIHVKLDPVEALRI